MQARKPHFGANVTAIKTKLLFYAVKLHVGYEVWRSEEAQVNLNQLRTLVMQVDIYTHGLPQPGVEHAAV